MKELRKSAIGILEMDILCARNLIPMKAKEGQLSDPYCVVKYGEKWVRTHTLLNTLTPQWNERYTWDVFDLSTVVTIAVFDDCHLSSSSHAAMMPGTSRSARHGPASPCSRPTARTHTCTRSSH